MRSSGVFCSYAVGDKPYEIRAYCSYLTLIIFYILPLQCGLTSDCIRSLI